MTFRWAAPLYLLLLLLPALLILWPRLRRRYRNPPALLYPYARLLPTGPRSWRLRLRRALPPLRYLAFILLVLALARPQWGQAQPRGDDSDLDIVFALDISNSMMALDFEPQNRLEAARQAIGDFIAQRPPARLGLVVFAGQAYVQSPLTGDHDTLLQLLASVRLAGHHGVPDGTALGAGIGSAASLLERSRAGRKLIILLTDGENTDSALDPLVTAAAESLGIHIYTIGMGRPGLVPFPQTGARGDYTVLWESPLDEERLQLIAQMTGAAYYRAEDVGSLRQIYREIERAEVRNAPGSDPAVYADRFTWLLWPAVMLLVVEWALRQTVLRSIP